MKKRMSWFSILVTGVIITGGSILMVSFTNMAKESKTHFNELSIEEIDLEKVQDGVFLGSFSIFPIQVDVEVEVLAHQIISIHIKKHVNGWGRSAESIVDVIVTDQSLDVPIISGATYSSKVILKAIEDALAKGIEGY